MVYADLWTPYLAVVVWRSESGRFQRPAALRRGTTRIPLIIEATWVEGDPIAGTPFRRRFVARAADAEGAVYRITVEGRNVSVEIARGPARPEDATSES